MSLYGVPQGVYYGQNERVDELNDRLQSRQFPDRPLAPNFSSRPIMTKYSRFPVMDRRAPAETPIQSVEPHSTQSNFSSPTKTDRIQSTENADAREFFVSKEPLDK